jgi:hypothetical protein
MAVLSTSSLGAFDVFPNEIMQTVLTMLDLASLRRFKMTCRRARDNVLALPGHQAIERLFPDLISDLRAVKILDRHSVGTILDNASPPDCISCDAPGPWIYLLTCQRYCINCWNLESQSCMLLMKFLMEVIETSPALKKHEIFQAPRFAGIRFRRDNVVYACLDHKQKSALATWLAHSYARTSLQNFGWPITSEQVPFHLQYWHEWCFNTRELGEDAHSIELRAMKFLDEQHALHKLHCGALFLRSYDSESATDESCSSPESSA